MLRREAARSAPEGTARGRARAYRESDSFAMWAVHHGVTVSMSTVSISSDPFILKNNNYYMHELDPGKIENYKARVVSYFGSTI